MWRALRRGWSNYWVVDPWTSSRSLPAGRACAEKSKEIACVPSKRPERHFRDIVDNIERIQRYTSGLDSRALYAEPIRIDAVERCFQRLTEAAVRLGSSAESLAPGIEWNKIRAFGNHLRHG